MGLWSYYFLLKLGLHLQGSLFMDWRLNLVFALAISIPLSRGLVVARNLIAIPLGAALMYMESSLPPLSRVLAEWGAIASFDNHYLLELAGRLFSLHLLLGLLVGSLVYWMLSCKFRMGSFAILGILILPAHAAWQTLTKPATTVPVLQQAALRGPQTPEELLSDFYQEESLRQTRFDPPLPGEAPFDIAILQLCSLAWDDLDLLGQAQAELLQRADIQLTAFNSAASYSGPAAIRLMRASCGQRSHDALYSPPSSSCLLLSQLNQVGYSTRIALNHDGTFGDFLSDITNNSAGSAQMIPNTGLAQTMRQFDGSPIYSDLAVLQRWAATQQQAPEFLYYNSTSLHDGNRLKQRPRLGSIESYPLRLQGLFSEITQFLDELESRNRPTIVILVAEHGAALRGDDAHIAGLRELPTPAVTHVPALVYLTGLSASTDPVIVDSPTSYLAIAELLARFIKQSPYSDDAPALSSYTTELPKTRFVSENAGLVVMRNQGRFLQRDPAGNWESLGASKGRYDQVISAR